MGELPPDLDSRVWCAQCGEKIKRHRTHHCDVRKTHRARVTPPPMSEQPDRYRDRLARHPGVPHAVALSVLTVIAMLTGPRELNLTTWLVTAGAVALWWTPVLLTARKSKVFDDE